MRVLPILVAAGLSGCVHEPSEPAEAVEPAPTHTVAWCLPTADLDGIGKDWDCDGYASDGYVGGTDCDDGDPAIHPGAVEVCDGVDNDCDGAVEPDGWYGAWYPDGDGDGFGRTDGALVACEAPAGHADAGGDCDDADPDVFPGAEDPCDGVDQACDGLGNERDGDGDGGLVCAGDCDDADPTVYPGAPDPCDGVDQACDGGLEDDADADGVPVCAGDCDDGDPAVFVGAAERCDGVDTDCDGVVPDDETDDDADGWRVCHGDCDDGSAAVSPDAIELCGDDVDEDCDGSAEVGCVSCDIAVPNDHATIQAAIDVAEDGEIVCVGAGEWEEHLDFGGAEITVLGVHGAALTVVRPDDEGPVVSFTSGEGPGAVLRGFTIADGWRYPGGGGVYVEGASPTLEDLVVTGNGGSWDAGAVLVDGGAPTLARVSVRGNWASVSYCGASYGNGGGIALYDADAVLQDVVIEDNHAGLAGGGLYMSGSSAVLANVVIADNSAGYKAGGVTVYGGAPTFTNVRITGNSVPSYWGLGSEPYAGGVAIGGAPTFENVVIAGNDDEIGAGGVYVGSGSPTFLSTVITGNDGGLYVEGGAATLAYSDVWGNGGADFVGMDDPTGTDGNLSVDPMLLAHYRLDADSPLRDAGDPSLSDPDGSRSDIGAFGGPGAASWDTDLDGWPAWWLPGAYDAAAAPDFDCDDGDDALFPGAGC